MKSQRLEPTTAFALCRGGTLQRSREVGGRDELGGATGTLTAKRERWIAKQRNGFSLPLSCSGGSSW